MKKSIIISILALVFIVGGAYALTIKGTPQELDNIEYEVEEQKLGGYDNLVKDVTVLDAVIATTTSSAIDIRGAKRVTLFLDQDLIDANDGLATTTFAVTVSTDKTTFITYNKLIDNVTNANSQDLTRVASKVVDDGTDYILSMDLSQDVFTQFKLTATTLTTEPVASTTVTVQALIEY